MASYLAFVSWAYSNQLHLTAPVQTQNNLERFCLYHYRVEPLANEHTEDTLSTNSLITSGLAKKPLTPNFRADITSALLGSAVIIKKRHTKLGIKAGLEKTNAVKIRHDLVADNQLKRV